MSLKNYLPVIISLLAGIGQIILIYHFHSNLQEVIYMQIITMTVLLLVMISFHVINSYLKMRIEMAGLQENVKIDGVLQVENV